MAQNTLEPCGLRQAEGEKLRLRKCLGSIANGGEIAQSLIEVAVIFPVLLLLVIGAAEFGRVSYAAIEATDAARAGCQYGSQNHIVAADAVGMQSAALAGGSDLSMLSATASHFCACSDGSGSTCASTDCTGKRMFEYVQVNTSATVNPLFHYPGSQRTFTVTGQSILRVAD